MSASSKQESNWTYVFGYSGKFSWESKANFSEGIISCTKFLHTKYNSLGSFSHETACQVIRYLNVELELDLGAILNCLVLLKISPNIKKLWIHITHTSSLYDWNIKLNLEAYGCLLTWVSTHFFRLPTISFSVEYSKIALDRTIQNNVPVLTNKIETEHSRFLFKQD